jgi:hypothetical protein
MSPSARSTKSGMSRPFATRSSAIAFVPVATMVLLGCSGSSGSFAGSDHDSGTVTGADAGPPTHADGATPQDGDSKEDAAPDLDAGHTGDSAPGDAGGTLLTPSPPPGATECGKGVITQASATAACMMPNAMLDARPLPDGGTTTTPRACDAITIGSGTWQVWCAATALYVWARFDGVNNTGTLHDCHGISLLEIDEGVYSDGSGGGNGADVATFELNRTEIAGLTTSMAEDVVFASTLPIPSGMGGTVDIFILGSLEDSCGLGGLDQETVLAGATVVWK